MSIKLKNVEIKARIRTPIAEDDPRLGTPCGILYQRDTYFRCPSGRLKLREESMTALSSGGWIAKKFSALKFAVAVRFMRSVTIFTIAVDALLISVLLGVIPEVLVPPPVAALPLLVVVAVITESAIEGKFGSRCESKLIHYVREDSTGPKPSDISIAEFPEGDGGLEQVLAKAYGISTVVDRCRRLYMRGRTRVHVDEVAGRGTFMELEVVLCPGEDVSCGEREARIIMDDLGIADVDLVTGSYSDM